MAGLRQVLGVDVAAGNEHTAGHAQPGLLKILDALPAAHKPRLVRGDNAFGNDALLTELEARTQPYLSKLKLTKNVKRYIGALFRQSGWVDAGQAGKGRTANSRSQAGMASAVLWCCAAHSKAKCSWPARTTMANRYWRSWKRIGAPAGHHRLRIRRAGHQHRLRDSESGPALS